MNVLNSSKIGKVPSVAGCATSRSGGMLVLPLLVGAAALLACSIGWAQSGAAQWATVQAAAKKEGRVVLYSATPPALGNRLLAGFRKVYPDIAVEFTRGPSGELLTKIGQEQASGTDGADVFISTEVEWFKARAKEGKLLKVVGPEVAGWPGKYLRDAAVVTAGLEPFTITYNTKLVTSNPPATYADMLRPEYKGRLGTSELAATTLIAWYDWLEKTQGKDYLQKLRAQNPKLYNGTTPLAQSLAAGEIAVGAFGNITSFKPLIDQGAPIKYVIPNPGLGFEYAMGGMGWSKRPNATLVFMDYVMSRDGQAAWHGTGEGASPRTDVPGSIPIANITAWDTAAYPAEVVNKYRAYWSGIFK